MFVELARRLVDEVVAAAVLKSVARAVEVFADDDEEGVQTIFAGACGREERFEVLFGFAFDDVCRRFGGSGRLAPLPFHLPFRLPTRRAGGGIESHYYDLGLRIVVGVGVVREEADAHGVAAGSVDVVAVALAEGFYHVVVGGMVERLVGGPVGRHFARFGGVAYEYLHAVAAGTDVEILHDGVFAQVGGEVRQLRSVELVHVEHQLAQSATKALFLALSLEHGAHDDGG